MSNTTYQITLIALLVLGLVLALTFLVAFRPRQWKRIVTWDASGWIILIALWYIRSLAVIATRWPNLTVPGALDGALSIGLLVVIDGLLIVRLVSFRAFSIRERAREDDNGSLPSTPSR